jgi:hypothetical protein
MDWQFVLSMGWQIPVIVRTMLIVFCLGIQRHLKSEDHLQTKPNHPGQFILKSAEKNVGKWPNAYGIDSLISQLQG